ncbi:MAG: hypothetical protein ACI93G_001501 [Hyphomonas sp.]|jgi:hypothetical protein
MRCTDARWKAMQVDGDAKRPMPYAWWNESRRTECMEAWEVFDLFTVTCCIWA